MKPTRNRLRIIFSLSVIVMLFRADGRATPQTSTQPVAAIYRGVSTALRFDISPPLSELAKLEMEPAVDVEQGRKDDPPSGLEGPIGPQDIDPIVQREAGGGEIPTPAISFDGMTNPCGGCAPPDPNGAVGPNHYVQMVNASYAIYTKTGTVLVAATPINTLWAGFGGACQTENAGDPIALYDRLANRWLLSQFTTGGPTYYNCVALSTAGDPTGSYYRWAFSTGSNFPDYPKYGIWSDAYYISTREFTGGTSFAGIGAYALNRAQMIAGNPAPAAISFLAPPAGTPYRIGDGLLPADMDGSTPPPPGTPEFYIGSQDNGGPYGAPSDALNIWKFHVDFVTPANSTFTLANTVGSAAFDSILDACGGTRACIPQPGTANRIDHLGYRQRPLHRAAYRNFGGYEAIVTNQSVEASAISGIRWWEIRNPNSSPTIYQEGTYAPGSSDGIHRWMGSVAQDHRGNMALGYSVSDGTGTFPGVRYTGRLLSDPLGTMPQGEGTLATGAGSQTGGGNRWGDYSVMNVDPTDDCTFWYTNEYYLANSSSTWKTRIGSFKFPSCQLGRPTGDVDADFKTDRTIFRPSTGVWYSALTTGGAVGTGWGVSSDIDVQGDYDGDGKADIAVWRPSTGTWYIVQSSTGTVRVETWGVSGDYPLAGDVDGDGKADLVIYRPSTGIWYFNKSGGGIGVLNWGTPPADYPLLGDFDGDGKMDATIYRGCTYSVVTCYGTMGFYSALSGGGALIVGTGTAYDIPAVGDFDGDGKSDPTIFRPSTGQWWIYRSTGGTVVVTWGLPGDIPVSGDWDGDGKSDFTVWRPSNGVWYTQFAAGGTAAVGWGVNGDKPSGRQPGS